MTRMHIFAVLLAAIGLGVGGAYLKGQWDAKAAREARDMRDALDTHERIDDADIGSGDASDDIDWLRNRTD
ncbi:MAG: hypothetical protein ACPG4X_19275 [Pikeienuella sp.]